MPSGVDIYDPGNEPAVDSDSMAPLSIKDVLTVFSPDSNYLALTSGDGRIKTWDVASGQMRGEFVDIVASTSGVGTTTGGIANGHLAVDYTSIAWGSSSAFSQKKAKKRNASFLLALGTGSGDVLGWDTGLGELRWRKDDISPGGVRCIVFSRNGQRLYTAGADGMICELDAADGRVIHKFKGSRAALSSVALSPGMLNSLSSKVLAFAKPDGDKLLAASAEIKLFDLASKKRIRKFTGHPATVKAMVFTEDGRHVLSSAGGDRHVAVWDCEREKSEAGAVFTLIMEQPAVALDCSGFGNNKGTVRVLALSETGVLYVWISNSVDGLSKVKPTKISVAQGKTASNKGSKSSRSLILAARFVGASRDGPGAVLVARGTVARPQFDRVVLDGQSESIVLTSANDGDLLPGAKHSAGAGKSKGSHDVAVLGPDNVVDAVLTRAHMESNVLQSSRKEKKRRASVDPDAIEQPVEPSAVAEAQADGAAAQPDGAQLEGAAAQPGGAAAMDVDAARELSMEDRLIALGIIESEDTQVAEENESGPVVVPRADSLQILLSQAIQSEDNGLLERCVGVTDEERIITKTVSKLHIHDAAKFLRLLLFKLETRPRRGLTLMPWIRAVLLQHSASLMSNPSMRPVLASLYQIADSRVAVFRPLLSLAGRLDLVVAQMPADNQQPRQEGPAVVYEDDGSEPESEDVMDEVDANDNDEVSEDEGFTLRPNGNGPLQDEETDDDAF